MKRGQGSSAGAITALLIMIAFFIALYVILLPPDERARLLNETYDENNPFNSTTGESTETLLLESPGLVSPVEDKDIEHSMNQVNLYVKNEPEISLLADSLEVSKSMFGGQDKTLTFSLENKDDLDKAYISFDVTDPKGTLNIELNGNNIFSEKISRSTSKVVSLPKEFLLSRNELYIYASSSFFGSSHFNLKNINIKKEYEVVNSREIRKFSLTNAEYDNLDTSKLEYFIYCNSMKSNSAILKIYLNELPLPAENLMCVSGERSLELDINDLMEGSNEIMFVIDQGDFLLTDIKIVNELKEKMFNTYYFGVDSDDYQDILEEDKDVVLEMVFDKKDSDKRVDVLINNDVLSINTRENEYSKDITAFVEEGENIIKVIPKEEFTIHSIRVSLE